MDGVLRRFVSRRGSQSEIAGEPAVEERERFQNHRSTHRADRWTRHCLWQSEIRDRYQGSGNAVRIARTAAVSGAKVKSLQENKARAVSGVRSVIKLPRGIAVVANSTWAAIKGRIALAVEWSEPPKDAFDSDAHWKKLETASQETGFVTRKEEPPPGTGAITKTIDATYHYPFYAHAPVETMNCVADVREKSLHDLGSHTGARTITKTSCPTARCRTGRCGCKHHSDWWWIWPAPRSRLWSRSSGHFACRQSSGPTSLVAS